LKGSCGNRRRKKDFSGGKSPWGTEEVHKLKEKGRGDKPSMIGRGRECVI